MNQRQITRIFTHLLAIYKVRLVIGEHFQPFEVYVLHDDVSLSTVQEGKFQVLRQSL